MTLKYDYHSYAITVVLSLLFSENDRFYCVFMLCPVTFVVYCEGALLVGPYRCVHCVESCIVCQCNFRFVVWVYSTT